MTSYDWWTRALAGEKIGGPTLPIHDGQPQLGFFRRRISKAGGYVGVAIWIDGDGEIVALRDGKKVDAAEEWNWVAKYPIPEAFYRQWAETGRWPDQDQAVTESLAPLASQEPGANNPPADPLTVKREAIETALKGLDDYAVIGTEEAAAKAQSLRSRLNELSNEADKEREKLVRPHLDAEKAVNKDWMPLVKMAKAGADAIRTALGFFETAQQRKRDAEEAERQRAARQAAKEAEDRRLEAEAAGRPAPEPEMPTAPPSPPAPVETKIKGAYGRAATKKLVKKARVVDYAAATAAMATHPELKALVDKLAQRAVDAGVTVAGVEFDEIVDVR